MRRGARELADNSGLSQRGGAAGNAPQRRLDGPVVPLADGARQLDDLAHARDGALDARVARARPKATTQQTSATHRNHAAIISPSPAGAYEMRVALRYPVAAFAGTKGFALTAAGVFGGSRIAFSLACFEPNATTETALAPPLFFVTAL